MSRRVATLLVVLALACTSLATPNAHAVSLPSAPNVVEPDPGPGTNGVIGVYAAIGCGMFSRALGSGFIHAGVIAGAIATCGFMFFDALVLER